MNWDTIKQPLITGIIGVLAAIAGGTGSYIATKPAEATTPAAQIAKAMPQLQIVHGMSGLCIMIDKPKP